MNVLSCFLFLSHLRSSCLKLCWWSEILCTAWIWTYQCPCHVIYIHIRMFVCTYVYVYSSHAIWSVDLQNVSSFSQVQLTVYKHYMYVHACSLLCNQNGHGLPCCTALSISFLIQLIMKSTSNLLDSVCMQTYVWLCVQRLKQGLLQTLERE